MSYSFKLLSHENKLLIDHLKNVGKLSKRFIKDLKLNVLHKELLSKVAYLIGISHDFAKSTTFFQKKIKENLKTIKADHSYLSSLFTFWLTKKFIEKNSQEKFSYLPLFSWLVVAKHHGDLENFGYIIENINDFDELHEQIKDIKENSLEELKEIYNLLLEDFDLKVDISEFLENVKDILNEIDEEIDKIPQGLNKYFEFILLYSVLIDADRLEASSDDKEDFEELKKFLTDRKELNANLVEEYKKQKFKNKKEIDILREKAYEEVISKLNQIDLDKERIFSIELPTGMGKTLTSFSFALKLREKIEKEKGYKPRIIYSLPFLSIIDQNAKIIEDVLKLQYPKIPTDIFLKHHHLADIKYITSKENEERKEYEKDKALLLIESWYSEIIITTFVQLFESLISVKNRAIRKVHNIANSIIILDEFQALPCEYWKLTREVIKFLAEKWNCYVIIMTATMPMIFEKNEIFQLIEKPEKYFTNEKLNRYVLYIGRKEKTIKEFFEEITEKIEKTNKDVLVVLNTVKSSQDLYKLMNDHLKGKAKISEEGIAEFEDLYLINLNSNIIPFHRIKRIEKIKKEKKRKIIISTQLVEAGVDIDVDVVYRDFAPIDAIVQSAGRCNRNGKKKGAVFVVKLTDNNGILYSRRIYGAVSCDIAEKILKDKEEIEEKEIRNLISKHFNDIKEKKKTSEYFDSLCELNFSEGKEAISTFSLIKEEFGKQDFCICFNTAKEIIDNIKELKKKRKEKRKEVRYRDKFKISAEIKDLRKKLESFIITPWVSERAMIPYEPDKELWDIIVIENPKIENPKAEKIYDIETGFVFKPK